ncbi:MAG: homocysteine S-methyltransferase family protein [Synergistaceae bacterium]|jgi:5-methyltetrahydrofolate--homocysteine methyltransferase|nr:homocysteine S-methyltransferase family protein [Synergistaceae bacterium]
MISRDEFKRAARERTIIIDGAYGTGFFDMGLGGVPSEVLNLEHPDKVETLHRAYVEAGCDLLLTNTFGGNRFKLEENSLEDKIGEIHAAAVDIARRAAGAAPGRRILVFGDISSTGRLPRPSGDGSFEECRRVYAEQASLLLEAGCDGLIVETMTDIKEMKSALIAIREISADVPLIAQMSFDESGSTLTGASIEVFAAVANDLEVDALGMNCLIGPEGMLGNLRRLAPLTNCLLSVEPNAGDPYFDGQKTAYGIDAAAFSLYAEEFVEAGASLIGGCCGTNSDYIKAIAAMLRGVVPASVRRRAVTCRQSLASRTSVHDIGQGFTVIGERINPTGKKLLRESMRSGELGVMLDEASAQAREGAHVLDVNFGVEKFFSEDGIRDAFVALDRATPLPLSIDVQSLDFLEAAMSEYPGRPLVNSSACDERSLSRKLPLLKKYGGIMILLAMESEISDNPDGRLEAVSRAIDRARQFGLSGDRFVVDPLVLSYGAGFDHKVTLEVIRLCVERGIHTIAGLSNLSHGMPNRSGINAAFLSMAIDCGLSGAIMNSGDSVVMQTFFGATLLKTGKLDEVAAGEEMDPLVEALLSGRSKVVDAMVDEKLSAGAPPIEVSQDFLGSAMELVGDLYEAKKIFLPHILFAAETAFPVFDRLNAMMTGEGASRGRVLLATVEGDIHDIGKNILATVLRAGGFDVIDIGKNVPADKIVNCAKEHAPDIVGLSAMMTTTVGRVSEVAESLRDAGLNVIVISGGASMNAELAGMYGVGYADNSSGALSLCKELMGRAS